MRIRVTSAHTAQVINKLDAEYDEEFLDREIMTMKKVCALGFRVQGLGCVPISLGIQQSMLSSFPTVKS